MCLVTCVCVTECSCVRLFNPYLFAGASDGSVRLWGAAAGSAMSQGPSAWSLVAEVAQSGEQQFESGEQQIESDEQQVECTQIMRHVGSLTP